MEKDNEKKTNKKDRCCRRLREAEKEKDEEREMERNNEKQRNS